MTEWFADESFWKELYPVLFPEDRFARAPEQVDRMLQLVDYRGGAILDLACGPGRHAIELSRRGYPVTGVDLSPFLLQRARERAKAAGVEVEWVQEDMRSFARPEAFRLALSMFTSFGYFRDPKDDLAVLRNIHASLAPGGACLLDLVGKEWVARHLEPTSSLELDDGTLLIERHEVRGDWDRMGNEWILLREGKVTTFRFEHRLYSAQELKRALQEAGFQSAEIRGDLEGRPYGPDAKRLIAIGRK